MRRRFEEFDRVFFATILILLLCGLIVLYSACHSDDEAFRLDAWKKQLVFAALGLMAFAICAAIPPVLWERLSPILYIAALGGLVLVLVAGSEGGGATRWISLGGFRLQPSEVAKVTTVLFLARVLSRRRRPAENIVGLLLPLFVVLLPVGLTVRQPDLGTAVVFLVALPPMLFWSGVSVPYLLLAVSPLVSIVCASRMVALLVFAALLLVLIYRARVSLAERITFGVASVAAAAASRLVWKNLAPYQQARLSTFLDPTKDSTGAGYQIIQSTVAVGSGGLTGVGYMDGTQKGLAFLPARHTDFIFSVLGEEFGFLGTMTILGLFALLLVRGLRIAAAARDPFAGLMVVGVLSMLAFQVFVNIGVTLGLVPVTGLPLPIFSYGGTSLLTTLGALGIVLGVGLRREDLMHRTLLDLGFIQIHSYGFFLALSFGVGIWLAGRRAEKRGIPAERITDVSLVIVLATVIGARGLYVATHWAQFAGRFGDVFRTWEGGLTMYGGAIPATLLGMWYLRRAGVDMWKAADAIAPSMAIGLGFTRIGCFLSGCCFGTPTDLPWGCVFPEGSHAGFVFPGEALHPAQLYASGAGFVIGAALLWVDRRKLPAGSLFLLFLALYSVLRTLLDLVRSYDETAYPLANIPVTLNQWISFAVFALALAGLARARRRTPA